ncbi:MAG: UPF0149 family protein [Chlorobiaceae bacterium]|nr:UPF0149 family protein [Chlorobiaceae bacterium]
MNPSEPLQQPLTHEELGLLEGFLLSDSTPDESLSSIEMLDGYMTALIVGPEEIDPELWMPFIWDQENDAAPVFSSEEEEKMIRELLVRHMNSIAIQFNEAAEEYLPLFEQYTYNDEEEKNIAIEDWALGFTVGMELKHESWAPLLLDEESAMLVLPMFVLGKITDDFDNLPEEEILDLINLLPGFVIKIYHYWKEPSL